MSALEGRGEDGRGGMANKLASQQREPALLLRGEESESARFVFAGACDVTWPLTFLGLFVATKLRLCLAVLQHWRADRRL